MDWYLGILILIFATHCGGGGTVSPDPEIHTNITNMFCPLCSASGEKYDAVLLMGCLWGCSLVGPWVKSSQGQSNIGWL